jgi:hypothetical protein
MKTLRSRNVRRKAKLRKKRILRNKVRHHYRRRYAGVHHRLRTKKKTVRRLKVKPAAASAKRKSYKVKPKSGSGLPPISMSTYMSMF